MGFAVGEGLPTICELAGVYGYAGSTLAIHTSTDQARESWWESKEFTHFPRL